jgi:hypothetical protein
VSQFEGIATGDKSCVCYSIDVQQFEEKSPLAISLVGHPDMLMNQETKIPDEHRWQNGISGILPDLVGICRSAAIPSTSISQEIRCPISWPDTRIFVRLRDAGTIAWRGSDNNRSLTDRLPDKTGFAAKLSNAGDIGEKI